MDKLLAEMAGLLRQSVRSSDVLGRGDKCEFVMLARQTGEEGARRIATRVRDLLIGHRYRLPGLHHSLDIAVGFSAVQDGDLSDNLALIARAEGALALAEADSENRTMQG